jgi:ABC-type multidrug transport system permease subunit
MERETKKEIKYRLLVWQLQAWTLRFFLIFFGLSAIIASVTVASRLVDASSNEMSWIAWWAAISSGILVSLNLEQKSNKMTNAWRTLNVAVQRYEKEDDFTIKDLNEASWMFG